MAEEQIIREIDGGYPREVGSEASKSGYGVLVLLGLLDGGLSRTEVIDALVMHGELPSLDERPEGLENEIKLVVQRDQWQVVD